MPPIHTPLTDMLGIEVPVICGAMYPCSNPELIAAVSSAGGIGIIQPVAMIFVHKHDLREGIRKIRAETDRPIGFNAIVERSRFLKKQMAGWIDVALEEGVRFFITALGNPDWVVDKVEAKGGVVFHDVTERKWALKALQAGVDGLISVNRDAGGHAGTRGMEELFRDLEDLGVPVVCAGGISRPEQLAEALGVGYAGVQMGTRFIATHECSVHGDYKDAILRARPEDIVLTDKISGVPCSVIQTPFVERMGTRANPIARWLLRHPRAKYWIRSYYGLVSLWKFKQSALRGTSYSDYFQAGRSVGGVDALQPAGAIVERFAEAARELGDRRAGAGAAGPG